MTTSPSRLRRLGAGTAAALALSGLAALATSAPAQAAPDRPGRGADRPAPVLGEQRASAVPGQYIVVLEDRADTAAAADARQTARGHGGQVLQRFDRALNGFSARLGVDGASRRTATRIEKQCPRMM